MCILTLHPENTWLQNMCVTKSKSKSHRWPRIDTQPGKTSSVITYRTVSIIPPFLILAGFNWCHYFLTLTAQQASSLMPRIQSKGALAAATPPCGHHAAALLCAKASERKSQASSNLNNVALSARLKCNDPTTSWWENQALLRFAVFERMSVSQHLP
jgi:hypothetical protein